MRYLFILLAIVLTFPFQIQGQTWQRSDYKKYNYRSFKSSSVARTPINFANVDYGLLNAAIFYLSNEVRVKNGKKTFSYSAALERAATGHSRDMIRLDFFSHTSPVSGKKSMVDRMKAEGVKLSAASENIAMNYASEGDTYLGLAQRFIKQWMESPSHKKNLLNTSYTYLGVGTFLDYRSKNDRYKYFKATQNLSATTGQETTSGTLDLDSDVASTTSSATDIFIPSTRSQLRSSVTRYLIFLGGDYRSKNQAERTVTQLKNEGFTSAQVFSFGNLYNVVVTHSQSSSRSNAALTRIRKRFPSAWLMQMRGN